MELLLTDKELARRLSISRATVWAWADKGIIPAPLRFGLRTTRWRWSEVQKALGLVDDE